MALLAIPPPDDAGEHDIGYTPIVIVLSPRYDASVVGPRTRVFLLKILAVRYQVHTGWVVCCFCFSKIIFVTKRVSSFVTRPGWSQVSGRTFLRGPTP